MLEKFKAYCLDESGMNAWTDKIFMIVGASLVGLALIGWAWNFLAAKFAHGDDTIVQEYRKPGNR